MIRLKNTRLVYYPIPKVACSSIKAAIARYNGDIFDDFEEVHDLYPTNPFQRPRLLDKSFTVIRDPIQRFVSGYRNRILHHRDMEPLGINDFALNLADICAENRAVDHHFAPAVRYIGTSRWRYWAIFHWHRLDEIKPWLARHGVDISLPHHQSEGPTARVSDLSAKAITYLRQFYEADYINWRDDIKCAQVRPERFLASDLK